MSISESYHKVYLFKSDFDAMRAEVCRHRYEETGGNLFGQWTTSGSVVIHVVLGPGKRCKRTTSSFEQDKEYMRRVERFVKEDYMLCHIGEWRFHHSPSSNKPSNEEERYVKRNFPKDVSKFLVIVVNEKSSDAVEPSPYFFTDGGKSYEQAEFVVLESKNPFSNQAAILKEINEGAEVKQQNSGSNSQRDGGSARSYPQVASSPQNIGSSIFYDNTNSTNSQVSPNSSHANPPVRQPNRTAQDQTANNESEVATNKEVVMKNTYDELEKYFDKGKVEIERSTHYGDINMIFEHRQYHWMLRFPKSFPDQPVKIFRTLKRRELPSSSPCRDYYLEKPLTNHVNILLSVKKNCISTCTICEGITKEKLTKPVVAVMIPGNANLTDVVKMLTNEIQMTFSTPLSFAVTAQGDGSCKINFEHSYAKWFIEFPSNFPNKPAEVYKQESRYGTPQKKTITESSWRRHEQRPLISSDHIMLAIRSNCDCSQCFKAH